MKFGHKLLFMCKLQFSWCGVILVHMFYSNGDTHGNL